MPFLLFNNSFFLFRPFHSSSDYVHHLLLILNLSLQISLETKDFLIHFVQMGIQIILFLLYYIIPISLSTLLPSLTVEIIKAFDHRLSTGQNPRFFYYLFVRRASAHSHFGTRLGGKPIRIFNFSFHLYDFFPLWFCLLFVKLLTLRPLLHINGDNFPFWSTMFMIESRGKDI